MPLAFEPLYVSLPVERAMNINRYPQLHEACRELTSTPSPNRKPIMHWLKMRSSLMLFSAAIILIGAARAQAVGGVWNVDADGNWSTPGNWLSNIIADGTDSTATFNIDITAPRTVSVDTART